MAPRYKEPIKVTMRFETGLLKQIRKAAEARKMSYTSFINLVMERHIEALAEERKANESK